MSSTSSTTSRQAIPQPSLAKRLARKINRSLALTRQSLIDQSESQSTDVNFHFPTSSWVVPYAVCRSTSSSSSSSSSSITAMDLDVKLQLPGIQSTFTPLSTSGGQRNNLRRATSSLTLSTHRCPPYNPSSTFLPLESELQSEPSFSPPSYETIQREMKEAEELEVRRRELLERDRTVSDSLRAMGL